MTDPTTSIPSGALEDRPAWAADWIPTIETRRAEISAHPVAGLAALFDLDHAEVSAGQPLPPLWHWVALSEWPQAAVIGPDGHPRTGDFMPPTPYPRRMWVGTSVEIAATPTVGSAVTIQRRVASITEKAGRQGTFALVSVTTTISTLADEQLLSETTQFAYRRPAVPTSSSGTDNDLPPSGSWLARESNWEWRFQPDPVMLMMFSALTANAHRIHYDMPYARGTEGYPHLLVHGPLMAVVLAEVVRQQQPDRQVRSIACRAQRPMFLGTTATVRRTSPDSLSDAVEVELVPGSSDGPAMIATLSFR